MKFRVSDAIAFPIPGLLTLGEVTKERVVTSKESWRYYDCIIFLLKTGHYKLVGHVIDVLLTIWECCSNIQTAMTRDFSSSAIRSIEYDVQPYHKWSNRSGLQHSSVL